MFHRNPSPSAASVCNSWLADRKSHTINFVNREVGFNCNFKTVKDGPTVSSEVVINRPICLLKQTICIISTYLFIFK